jgi:hypothetical protein
MGLDTKTDCQLRCDFDFGLKLPSEQDHSTFHSNDYEKEEVMRTVCSTKFDFGNAYRSLVG